ncbi:hypothetical protein CHS0354_023611 [Potamilus streckersoni]|uniref:Aromatic amino acid beta-eliminating lyase/threonine aldolase domain-containing protein n=1 Tax=Potamilus streckersoni TaxID=2493646 RepID=A0AAE0VYE5_9BIVA|nr:hypothetical protein CHS0354_023611 [Potamilus streckersoni]
MFSKFEPYRIKTVEPIPLTTRENRQKYLEEVAFNPNCLKANQVTIDLMSDSGANALSCKQWSAMMQADESYAGADSFYTFETTVKKITGFPFIVPVHQGRAAEKILFKVILSETQVAYSNGFFDTTRDHILQNKVKAINIDTEAESRDFMGNIDCRKLEEMLSKDDQKVGVVVMTITNGEKGGWPVSIANIKEAAAICRKHNVLFYADACRFAENTWFIKTRENGFKDKTPSQIALEMFNEFDGCIISAKKDGICNIGGVFATRQREVFENFSQECILAEGHITYGGLAGRDLEAIAVGLTEALDEHYLQHRIEMVQEFGRMLELNGATILEPGGHAIFVDANKALPHIPRNQHPAWALTCALYVEGGIRAYEYGNIKFGYKDENGKDVYSYREFVRLAIPRRVYTMSHLKYVAEVFGKVIQNASKVRGLTIVRSPPFLGLFAIEMKEV